MTKFFTGKRPATYDKRDLLYNSFRPKDLYIPVSQKWGLGMDFPNGPTGWKMLGNGPDDDGSIPSSWAAYGGCGNCEWAGPAHETMQAAHQAGKATPKFSGKTMVEQYSAYCGYNPQTGANDNGSDTREVLTWRQTKGIYDDDNNTYKIGTFVQLELGNWDHLREACWLFECVGLGFQFPVSAMDQVNAGKPWTVVSGASIDGGHYVPIVGHPAIGWWTCITWGQRQMMSVQFIQKYADEMWAYIDPERYNQVTGLTYNNYQDADLELFLHNVAQLKGLLKKSK